MTKRTEWEPRMVPIEDVLPIDTYVFVDDAVMKVVRVGRPEGVSYGNDTLLIHWRDPDRPTRHGVIARELGELVAVARRVVEIPEHLQANLRRALDAEANRIDRQIGGDR